MIFGEKSKNLAHFLLTAALLAASSATFAQTENFISREDRPHPSSGLDLSQEGILDSSNIHQAEVDSVLAEGISYSDAQRVADFPELLDLLNSESVHKKKIFASKSLLQRIESPRTAMSGSAFDQKSDFGNPLLFAFKNSESVKRFGSGCGHDRFDSLVGSSSSLRKKRKKTTGLALMDQLLSATTSGGDSIVCPALISQGAELSCADLFWKPRSTSAVHFPEGGGFATARRQWFSLGKNALVAMRIRSAAAGSWSDMISPEGRRAKGSLILFPGARQTRQAGPPTYSCEKCGGSGVEDSRYDFNSLALPSSPIGFPPRENKWTGPSPILEITVLCSVSSERSIAA